MDSNVEIEKYRQALRNAGPEQGLAEARGMVRELNVSPYTTALILYLIELVEQGDGAHLRD